MSILSTNKNAIINVASAFSPVTQDARPIDEMEANYSKTREAVNFTYEDGL